MPNITFIEFSGEQHKIVADEGKSLMLNAIEQGVPGIDADCGGACACGTCHCFIEGDAGEAKLGEVDPLEESMLSMRPDRETSSRLSCQIDVTHAMDGLVVRLPEYQM